jgi:hypothetical protein
MLGDILQFEDLQRLCRPSPNEPAPKLRTVARWAESQGIRYLYDGKGGIFTTMSALQDAVRGRAIPAGNDDTPLHELI